MNQTELQKDLALKFDLRHLGCAITTSFKYKLSCDPIGYGSKYCQKVHH